MRTELNNPQKHTGRLVVCLCIICAFAFFQLPVPAHAEEPPVRVGYYENEVFQEGASDGAVKTGYA